MTAVIVGVGIAGDGRGFGGINGDEQNNFKQKLTGVNISHVIEVGLDWALSGCCVGYHPKPSSTECPPHHQTLLSNFPKASFPAQQSQKDQRNMQVREETRALGFFAFLFIQLNHFLRTCSS